ncbi:MAG: hypothetical protein QOF44_2772 [Streptomyces sp.]|nr:hypothetical protein [Streptomyces sp.]
MADEDGIAEPLSPAVSEAGRQPFRGGGGATALRTARRCAPHALRRTGAAAPQPAGGGPGCVPALGGLLLDKERVPVIHTVRGAGHGHAIECPEERR